MQLFEAKPIFCVCEGSEDEHWWLTDVKKRKEEDEKKPDEDGPPSSESDARKRVQPSRSKSTRSRKTATPIARGVTRSRCRRGA